MTSLFRSYIFRFFIGFLIVLIISPIPALLLTHESSYLKGLLGIFYNSVHFPSISIPMIDWMHESILFSPQPIMNSKTALHASGHSTPLFPYMWEVYFFSITRFTLTLAIGFFISLAIGRVFFKAPKSLKKYILLLHWVPYSFSTVVLQCSIILFSLYIAKYITVPFFSSLIIIFSTSMIIVIQAIKKWLPFLSKTEDHEIRDSSFLVNTLFIALASNHKSILSSIILSFCFMECIFHTNGLLQFIIQFGGSSPTVVTIGLLLLYIPYIVLSFFQSLWRTNHSKQQTYAVTRTLLK
ncbi:hypothetical protein CON65_22405 [Bacillus pseudomycoides]|uniref:Uncharacterized protein n=1 Tax=Bacillus pseudomycoides TaxID=64104 RepID=A0AA91V9M2_9BACI|nr:MULTISPECIES: hypothetical protein [Bacillus]PEB54301.1 hypothetical protein COO03_05970 [Bacillus sp. AFS098217]PED80450.1 hypothetical protein CON65_22405 [Bacillus pseudomycoides]PEU11199.1 hypothetical protein CN525_22730 [Bacillus sp. AFS014408]PEU13060.1 hypothetical protein CN524_11960 [Bacillus sp. AFS019443]PFW61965.1 hypothetical protein COL20_15350 [Bacillus sp. AFS075034]